MHPNEEPEENIELDLPTDPWSWSNSRFVNWFVVFDVEKIKPFLIKDYDFERMELEDRLQKVIHDAVHDSDAEINGMQ